MREGQRTIFYCILLFGVYAFVALTSLRLFATLNASASPVWPPTGLAIAVLLLWGPRLWPGVLFGAFTGNILTTGDPATSAAIAVGNALEALTGYWLVSHFVNGVHAFDRARNLGLFIVTAGLAAPLVSATIGVTSLSTAGFVPWPDYGPVWFTWWLGDASGALTIAPLILTLVRPPKSIPAGSFRELIVLASSILITIVVIFSSPAFLFPLSVRPGFTLVPLIAWAGLRFGSRGASLATLFFSVVAVWSTLSGFGPFASSDTNTALLSLQYGLMSVAMTGLAFSALVYERTDAEEETRKAKAAERRFQTMVESAPDAIVIADTQGKIIQVNTQTETMFGYSRDELLRLRVEDLIPEDYRKRHVAHRAWFHEAPHARAMGVGMELFGQRKDGTDFPVEISLSPLQTDAGMMVSSSIRDISERKTREAELDASRRQAAMTEKLSALGTMVSGVAHEVRTPLTYISTNLVLAKTELEKMVRGETLPDEASAKIEQLILKSSEGVDRANTIVRLLRQFAAAHLKTEPSPLHDVVANAVELFRSVNKGQVTVDTELKALNGFEVDKGQMEQVVINLLNNGAEAMGKTGTLKVSLREVPGGAELDVEDKGLGIPVEVQSRIFDPFFTTKEEGTGLGLSVSRRIIEAHGGSIRFRTSPSGTTFTVAIPQKPVNKQGP